ncbi:O-antigen ligase family protein [Actinokineospora iranica]|uniref:O-antigen ligase n=1 Tax=Actinokineospora iranica TaxID=1271860 RepID=A0A1G6XET2_9PSEU|nr:O-antigen ligase family protein [Actinokineospora iranica]SDD75847.1 O-antigen ligase [Actinokineospora iranica]
MTVHTGQSDALAAGLLRSSACAVVATAPVEGYLMALHPHLAKAPAAVLATTWVVVRVRQRRLPAPHPAHVVLAVLAVVLLSTSAVHAAEPFSTQYLLRWLPFLAITVILVDVAAREAPVRTLLAAAVGGAAVAGAGALYSMAALGESRATGPLEDPNDLAYVLVAALPLTLALLPPCSRSGARRTLVAVVAAVLVLGAAATFSRGGALAALAAVGWLLLRRTLRARAVAMAVLVIGAAGVLGALAASEGISQALREKTYIAATNVDTRELRWAAAARMLAENPVLGVGAGGFRSTYAAASHNAELDEQVPVAHSMYLEVAAELGLPGLVSFLGLVAVAILASERVLASERGPWAGERRLMVAAQASLLAVLVASAFLSQQYYLPLWFLVALVCAADLRVQEGRRGGGHARLAGDQ